MTWLVNNLGSVLTFAGVVVTGILSGGNRNRIQKIEITLNSRLDAMLAAIAVAARHEGAPQTAKIAETIRSQDTS